jgi:hypothetical protein
VVFIKPFAAEASRPYGQLQGLGYKVFIAFRLNSILNKQKIIKKIAFLVKMAKIASFRPNHKIFSGSVEVRIKKKSIQKLLEIRIIFTIFTTKSTFFRAYEIPERWIYRTTIMMLVHG